MYLRGAIRLFLFALLACSLPGSARAYSVLTHEQLIDLTWKDLLQPLILSRFPQTSSQQLQESHAYAYAYGGCAIQDVGYYPGGNEFFSDLTHYVRTGKFIMNLLGDARDANEYAFALGALSHYVGDNVGHHDAVNPATAISFPKLGKKYGPVVTFGEDRHAHIRTEFAFDIDQLSHSRLAPSAYLRFVGLKVPGRLLVQSFEQTYSLRLRDVLGKRSAAVHSYRTAVRSFLPRIAYAETVIHKSQFPPDVQDDVFETYLNRIARADFQTEWNRYRRKPTIRTHLLALLIRILPKIGTLSDLSIKVPTPETQDLFVKSVDRTVELYGKQLKRLAASSPQIPLIPDRDLDTGEKTRPGAYVLTDQTYAELLHKVATDPGRLLGPGLKSDIVAYYADPNAPIATKKNARRWAQVQEDLSKLEHGSRLSR